MEWFDQVGANPQGDAFIDGGPRIDDRAHDNFNMAQVGHGPDLGQQGYSIFIRHDDIQQTQIGHETSAHDLPGVSAVLARVNLIGPVLLQNTGQHPANDRIIVHDENARRFRLDY